MAAPTAVVSEEQWAEARRLFEQQLHERECATLTKAKYDRILDLITSWDTLTPAQRRGMSGGNHMYWNAKYAVAPGTTAEDDRLVLRDGNKRVVHQDDLFDSIKAVHVQSTPAHHIACLTACWLLALLVVCLQSCTAAIVHFIRRAWSAMVTPSSATGALPS